MTHNEKNTPLFGAPLHEQSRLAAPPTSFYNGPPAPAVVPASNTSPALFSYDEHDHKDHHHDHNDHEHDHDHEHEHEHDHDHEHEHHNHSHDHDHHDHDHHEHSHHHEGHDHEHSHHHDHHDDHHDHEHSHHHDHHDDHHDHDHNHDHHDHDHSHSHSNTSFNPYSKASHNRVSQRNSNSPALPYPNITHGSTDEMLQSTNQGFVFTAPKNDGWVHEGDSWNHNYQQEGEEKIKTTVSDYIRIIWVDKDAKNLFMFIILSTTFTFVEILYGTMSNSLGLISEAFHTFFDNIAMVISLMALVLSRSDPNNRFSYGYDRIEILSGFANGAFLLFVSFFLFVESVERILEPPELHSHGRVISVAFVGLIINALGIMFFSRHSLHRSESIRSKARQDNMNIITTHLFTDMISGIGVIISSWLGQSMGWHFADTLVSIIIAVLIVRNAWPICSKTARVLLQTTPDSIYPHINKCLREASTLEGVLEYHSEHFWTQSPGIFVGSLSIKIRADANEQAVLQQVTKLFQPHIRHLTVQIEKDNWNLE